MQYRAMRRIWLAFALFVLASGMSVGFWGAGASAQSTPPATPPSVEELQAQIAELQAQVAALQTENEQLKQRITDLAGPQQQQASTPDPAANSALTIGQTYTGEFWEVTVTGYEISPTIDSSYEQNVARGVFCLVYFTVINTSNAPAAFPYDDMRLTSSDGRTYTPDQDAVFNLVYVIYENDIPSEPLQPGLPYTTAIAFDIPPTATGLSFTTSEEVFVFTLD